MIATSLNKYICPKCERESSIMSAQHYNNDFNSFALFSWCADCEEWWSFYHLSPLEIKTRRLSSSVLIIAEEEYDGCISIEVEL